MEQFPSLPSARLDSFIQSELSASPQAFMSDFADATHNLLMGESAALRAAAATKLAELGRPAATLTWSPPSPIAQLKYVLPPRHR